jgi:hypothetical protein
MMMASHYFIVLFVLSFYAHDLFALNYKWHKKSCLTNVVKSVQNISTTGEAYAVNTDGFFSTHEYKNTFKNAFGLDNHFQGITYNRKRISSLLVELKRKIKLHHYLLSIS